MNHYEQPLWSFNQSHLLIRVILNAQSIDGKRAHLREQYIWICFSAGENARIWERENSRAGITRKIYGRPCGEILSGTRLYTSDKNSKAPFEANGSYFTGLMPRVSRARFVLALSVLVKERPRHTCQPDICIYSTRIRAHKLPGFYSFLESWKVPFNYPGIDVVSTVVRSREQQWDVLLYRAKRRNFSLNIIITFTRAFRAEIPLPRYHLSVYRPLSISFTLASCGTFQSAPFRV